MPRKQPTLNQYVTQTKFLVFTGAGASAPLGYALMRTFMDNLEANVSVEAQAILQQIYSEKLFPDGSPGRDLEMVISAIGEKKSVFDLIEKDAAFAEVQWPDGVAQARRGVEEIHGVIRREIFRHYGNAPDSAMVRSLFSPVFTTMSEALEQTFIPIFTTNYDPAIETFADATEDVGIEFGFALGTARSPWQPRQFHDYKPLEGRLGLALFKLHGSVTWYKDALGIRYVQAAQLGLAGNQNMLIYPGEVKTDVYVDPYRTSYAYLRHALSNANYAFVIGYSFRDDVLQTVFADALLQNPTLQIVVINGTQDQQVKDDISSKLGKAPTFIDHPFEIGEDPAYLQALRRLLSPAPEIAEFGWLGKTLDLVGPSPGAYEPDGQPDGTFRLVINAARAQTLEKVELFRVDSDGSRLGDHWTSAPDNTTWALGISHSKSGAPIGAGKKVPLKRGEEKELWLAASDTEPVGEWFGGGQWYEVALTFGSGHTVSAKLQIPAEG